MNNMLFFGSNKTTLPFYLKCPFIERRTIIVVGLMLSVLSMTYPYFLTLLPIYIGWIVYEIKRRKRRDLILLNSAIALFIANKLVECQEALKELFTLDNGNLKGRIIWALLKYKEENYKEALEYLDGLPNKVFLSDIDLMLKYADCAYKCADNDKAIMAYERLLKIYPGSEYVKDKLKSIKKLQS